MAENGFLFFKKEINLKPLNFFNESPKEGKLYVEALVTKHGDGKPTMSISVLRIEKITREECGDRGACTYLKFVAVPAGAKPSERVFLVGHSSNMEKLDTDLFFEFSEETLEKLRAFEASQCVCDFYQAIGKKLPGCLKEEQSVAVSKQRTPRPAVGIHESRIPR